MKLTRKTKIRIRKALARARTIFMALFWICVLLTIGSADGPSLVLPIVCFAIGLVCYGIAYTIDKILYETAWSGDPESPFMH